MQLVKTACCYLHSFGSLKPKKIENIENEFILIIQVTVKKNELSSAFCCVEK